MILYLLLNNINNIYKMVANNPQSFLNGYLSAMRNSIITTSLGVAIYGF